MSSCKHGPAGDTYSLRQNPSRRHPEVVTGGEAENCFRAAGGMCPKAASHAHRAPRHGTGGSPHPQVEGERRTLPDAQLSVQTSRTRPAPRGALSGHRGGTSRETLVFTLQGTGRTQSSLSKELTLLSLLKVIFKSKRSTQAVTSTQAE